MNAHAVSDIRELTTQELDQVAGGIGAQHSGLEGLIYGAVIGTLVCSLLDWLFG